MKILKKKIYIFFFEIGIFFFKLGKKSPKSHWERGRISAPEDKKKSLIGKPNRITSDKATFQMKRH